MTAELLLVLRLTLADGEAGMRTGAALARVAARALGLAGEGALEVLAEVEHLFAAVGAEGVRAVMCDLPLERRRTLALRIAAIAAADEELQPLQARLGRRLGMILGLAADEAAGK